MGTQSVRDVLGFATDSPMDHANRTRPSPVESSRDTNSDGKDDVMAAAASAYEHVPGARADEDRPRDGRFGGVAGTNSTTRALHSEDADTVHDGYGGRGSGKKDVTPKLT